MRGDVVVVTGRSFGGHWLTSHRREAWFFVFKNLYSPSDYFNAMCWEEFGVICTCEALWLLVSLWNRPPNDGWDLVDACLYWCGYWFRKKKPETLMRCPIFRSYFGTLLFLDKGDLLGKGMYNHKWVCSWCWEWPRLGHGWPESCTMQFIIQLACRVVLDCLKEIKVVLTNLLVFSLPLRAFKSWTSNSCLYCYIFFSSLWPWST